MADAGSTESGSAATTPTPITAAAPKALGLRVPRSGLPRARLGSDSSQSSSQGGTPTRPTAGGSSSALVPSTSLPSVTNSRGETISLSDRVWLVDGSKHGTVMFLGLTKFKEGVTWAGLELDDQFVGKHNGMVGGVRYFTCAPERGVFVSSDKVSRSEKTPSTVSSAVSSLPGSPVRAAAGGGTSASSSRRSSTSRLPSGRSTGNTPTSANSSRSSLYGHSSRTPSANSLKARGAGGKRTPRGSSTSLRERATTPAAAREPSAESSRVGSPQSVSAPDDEPTGFDDGSELDTLKRRLRGAEALNAQLAQTLDAERHKAQAMEKTLTTEVGKSKKLSGQLQATEARLGEQLRDLRSAEEKLFLAEERLQQLEGNLATVNGELASTKAKLAAAAAPATPSGNGQADSSAPQQQQLADELQAARNEAAEAVARAAAAESRNKRLSAQLTAATVPAPNGVGAKHKDTVEVHLAAIQALRAELEASNTAAVESLIDSGLHSAIVAVGTKMLGMDAELDSLKSRLATDPAPSNGGSGGSSGAGVATKPPKSVASVIDAMFPDEDEDEVGGAASTTAPALVPDPEPAPPEASPAVDEPAPAPAPSEPEVAAEPAAEEEDEDQDFW